MKHLCGECEARKHAAKPRASKKSAADCKFASLMILFCALMILKMITAYDPFCKFLHPYDPVYGVGLSSSPVVSPKRNRINAWEYDQVLYCRRNEVERLFRRLKGFRRIFSRFEKLDRMFCAFIHFVLSIDALR
jgi:hypothetical protein